MFKGRPLCLLVLFLIGPLLFAQHNFAKTEVIQLSEPVIEVDSVLFVENATVSANKGELGASVFYEIEGEKQKFKEDLKVHKSTKVSFWAEHPDFEKSAATKKELVKILSPICDARLQIRPQPNVAYKGKGWKTLVDLQKGPTSFKSNDQWLGFQDKSIEITISFKTPREVSKVLLGLLVDHASWIFLPKSLEVKSSNEIIGSVVLETPASEEKPNSTFITTTVTTGVYDSLILTINGLKTIPDWHPGKGTTPWLFIDELLIEP